MAKTNFWDRYHSFKQEMVEYIKNCKDQTFEGVAVDYCEPNNGYVVEASLLELKDGQFLLNNPNWLAQEWCEIEDVTLGDLCYIADELTPKNE